MKPTRPTALLLALLLTAPAVAQDNATAPKLAFDPATHAADGSELAEHERAFQAMLSGKVLVGTFTLNGVDGPGKLREERYTIQQIYKMQQGNDYWMFLARVQYGGKDITVPMPLPVKWAGDTPMVQLTDLAIPGLGTFTSRVLFYRGEYAGTWKHGKHGGQMFGRIEEPGKQNAKSDDAE